MLTPRDLLKVEFKTVFRGYSPEQVDEFVKKAVAGYEALCQENQQLKAELEEAQARAEELRRNEERVDELLQLARKAVEDAQETARREADLILHEGRAMAAREMEKARAQYREQLERLRQLRLLEGTVRRRIRLLLESLLHQLDEPEEAEGGVEDIPIEEEADQLLAEWADPVGDEEAAPAREIGA